MLSSDDFQRNFPPGVPVPEPLRLLLEFQNQELDWYSGHFELDHEAYGDAAWFMGDQAAAEQFVVLGHDSDGSQYCLWLYPGRTVADAPVVYLGSEGTDSGLIAADLAEFLGLLALDADELGLGISEGEITPADPPAERGDEFRAWLESTFGIVPPADPLATVASARTRHPDFDAWLADWQETH